MMAADLTTADPVLEIRGLDISLPPGADRPLAVEGVSLTLRRGETLCIVGESGSGKSTVADAVIGLLPRPHLRPSAGQILYEGQDLLTLDERQMRTLRGRRIGMVFQEPMVALNPVMRIGDQIAELIDAHMEMRADEKRQRVLAALRDVHLPDPETMIDSYPFRLSGGQRQRVVIAMAMLLEPALLIADEPTTALDVTTQAQILKLIRQLQERRNTAVLFITHDFGVVSQIADHVAVMQTGRIVEAGPREEVLVRPKSAYTRQLIAAIPHGTPPARPRSAEPPLLDVRDLRISYAVPGGLFSSRRTFDAVRGLSFHIAPGETLGLVGESGSGKSTIGRAICGLTLIREGKVGFRGKQIAYGSSFRQQTGGHIQMIFQDPYASLNPRQTIGDAIAAGPIFRGVERGRAERRARELLDRVGLPAQAAERYPHEFSGGQRQRVGIARALAMEPALIVADEPVSALDVSVQAQVLDLFVEIRKEFGLAMLFITHDLRVAGQMCDRIAVMEKGVLVEQGPTQELLAHPRHEYTRRLFAAVPQLDLGGAASAAVETGIQGQV